MSDSDSELLTNNVFTFQNKSTMISVKGPNTKGINIQGIGFGNNVLSSTFQMPRNFECQRSESNFDQRSMHSFRRETSPMSIMSACDARQRILNNSLNPRGTNSQRSIVYGRSRSPMSMRSIDSSASVSAAVIAMALKSENYNKYEMRVLQEAFNKCKKKHYRRKIKKRRNLKHFLRGYRRRSGGDSADCSSDSSLSSDGRSTKTLMYRENTPSCRSTKTDISDFRRTIKESNMYKDCTNNFRHNSFLNVAGPVNLNNTQSSTNSHKSMLTHSQSSLSSHRSMITGSNMTLLSMPAPANFTDMQRKPRVPVMPLKERFKSGFLLPSQRFNRSVASTKIPEIAENFNHHESCHLQNGKESTMNEYINIANNIETDSDQEDMFSEATNKQKTNDSVHSKRSIDSVDAICLPHQKRTKTASPCRNSIEARKVISKETTVNSNCNDTTNEFVFAKPTLPVRKSVKEKLISKSAAPLTGSLIQDSALPSANIHTEKPVAQEKERDHEDEQSDSLHNSTNLSMRPSFIKRKLFTQKLDLAEKKNVSTDGSDSPQGSIYSAIQKEKHRARKLQHVTTQSCLSRDILGDESNLIDLIHKIVPIEQMNLTNQTNKTDLQSSKNKSEDDKFDIISIMTACEDDDVSNSYTDEESFNATVKASAKENTSPKKKTTTENVSKKHLKENNCKILVEKLTANNLQKNLEKSGVMNKSVQKCIKSFWDTDFESDDECLSLSKYGKLKNNHVKEVQQKEPPKFQGFSTMFNSKESSTAPVTNTSNFLNNTVNSVQKFNNKTLRVRSHRTPKRKKLDQTRNEDAKSTMFEPQSKKQKTFQASSTIIELSKLNPKQQTESQDKISKETLTTQITKPDSKKSPKGRKQAPKTKKNNKTAETNLNIPATKPTNSNKNQEKTNKNVPQTNNKKDAIQSEQKTKKESKQKKTTHSPQKINNVNQDNTLIKEQSKANTNSKKTTQINNTQKTNSKLHDQIDIDKINNQLNTNSKVRPPQVDTTKKQNHTTKKPTVSKTQTKKPSPKTKKTIAPTLNNESIVKDETKEENNNGSYRTVRSCRRSKQIESLDKTDLEHNGTIIRSLRTRQIDVSSTLNGSTRKAKEKNNGKDTKSRLSDVSFSLTAGKNAVAKRAVTKLSNSRFFKTKDVETSDISFSLTAIESPTPKKAISIKSRVNSKTDKMQNKLTKSTLSKRNEESMSCKSGRNRIPNKRYLIC